MPQSEALDGRYTEGIWYDMTTGDFCRIQQGYCEKRGVNLAELVCPETGTVYYDLPVPVWKDHRSEFRRVRESAVDDPKVTVCRALNIASLHDIDVDINPIDLQYAWSQVEIREK